MECHRTWLKVMLNPILRWFGWQIVSVIDTETDKFIRYELRRYSLDVKVKQEKKKYKPLTEGITKGNSKPPTDTPRPNVIVPSQLPMGRGPSTRRPPPPPPQNRKKKTGNRDVRGDGARIIDLGA